MKKSLRKYKRRVSAVAFATLMLFYTIGSSVMPVVAAEQMPARSTNLYDLLSKYQYVTEQDLTVNSHTVGAVLVGGNANLGAFGDAALAPTYVEHLISAGNYNVGAFFRPSGEFPGLPGYDSVSAYYNTIESGVSGSGWEQYTNPVPFADFSGMYTTLRQNSIDIANSADYEVDYVNGAYVFTYQGNAYTGDLLNVTSDPQLGDIIGVNVSSGISVRFTQAAKANITNIDLITTDINNFQTNPVTISFMGNDDNFLNFGYNTLQEKIGIRLNGSDSAVGQMLKSLSGVFAGDQVLNGSMKLLWNFPEAETVKANFLGGHVLAPKAAAEIRGGRFEGTIIAKSVVSDSEGHMYPYNGLPQAYTEESYGKLIITKTIEGDVTKEELEGQLTFKITKPDGSVENHKLSDFTYNAQTKIYTYTIDPAEVGRYTVEETDYDVAGNECTVSYAVDNGRSVEGTSVTVEVTEDTTTKVDFKDVYDAIPVPPVNPLPGKLIITKTIEGDVTKEELEGQLTFKITKPDGSVENHKLSDFTYNAQTKIYTYTIDPAEVGRYTVEETDYDVAGNQCTVSYAVDNGTTVEGTRVTVEVTEDTTTKVDFKDVYDAIPAPPVNPLPGKLIITKTIEGDVTKEELEGQLTFKITKPDGSVENHKLSDFTYNAQTKIYTYTIDPAEVGRYIVEETDYDVAGNECTVSYAVDNGRSVEGTRVTVEVTEDTTTKVDFKDVYDAIPAPPVNPLPGKLIITKTIEGDVTKEELEGQLTFKITKPDGSVENHKLSDFTYNAQTKIYTYTIDPAEVGRYTVEETDYDVAGNECTVSYAVDNGTTVEGTRVTVEVTEDTTTKVDFKDVYVPVTVSVSLIKTYAGVSLENMDTARRADMLAHTKFTLYNEEECLTIVEGTSEKALIWDENGGKAIVTFDGLRAQDGTQFYMKETEAPAGYGKIATTFEAKVVKQSDETYKVQYFHEDTATYRDDFPVCKNKRVAGFSHKIRKVSSADTSVCLMNAKFSLYEYSVATQTVGNRIDSVVSDANGYIPEITGLEEGEYLLVETAAPSGYVKSDINYIIFVSFDADNNSVIEFARQDTPNDRTETIDIPNDPILTYAEPIQLYKEYENVTFEGMSQNQINRMLSNTVFTLYKYNPNTERKTKLGSVNPELKNGKAEVSFENSGDLVIEADAMYYFEETKAPDGYVVSESGYFAKVDASGNVTYSVSGANGRYSVKIPTCLNKEEEPVEPEDGILIITKTIKGDVTKEEAEGAIVFKVTKPDKTIKKYTLKDFDYDRKSNKYTLTLKKLKNGKYTVEETAYDIDGMECTVTYQVNDGDTHEGDKVTVSVSDGDTNVVSYEDSYEPVHVNGELILTKTLAGNVQREDAEDTLKFVVTRVADGKSKAYTLKDFEYSKKNKRYELTLEKEPGKYLVQETVYDIQGYETISVTYTIDDGDEIDGRDKHAIVKIGEMDVVSVHFRDEYRATSTGGEEGGGDGGDDGGSGDGSSSSLTTSSTSTTSSVPKTGDKTPVAMLFVLAAAALAGCFGIVVFKRKRKS